MPRPVLTATALEVLQELPSGTLLSAGDLQREVAWRLRPADLGSYAEQRRWIQEAGLAHSAAFRALAEQLARLGRLRPQLRGDSPLGCTLYLKP